MASDESLDLFFRLKNGDDRAAQEIFDRYADRLMVIARRRLSVKFSRRVDPEDVVQSVMRSFFRRTLDGQFDFVEGKDLWRLLSKITLRKVLFQIRHHQAGKRDVNAETSVDGDESNSTKKPLAVDRQPSPVDANIFMEELQALLAELSPPYRRIIELRLQGFRVREIAEQQGCSERTIHRAVQQFNQILAALVRIAEKENSP
jgi:RNA polymerase sigma-70 factor (ECF subfamily)